MTEAFWIACALVLIIEGLGPMLVPKRWKAYVMEIAKVPPHQLRTFGGVLVTIGLVCLFFLLKA